MAKAYLSLGANIPPEKERLRESLSRLSKAGVRICAASSLYHTEPWGKNDQPWFLNLVVEVETDLSPQALLSLCKKVEKALGRVDRGQFGPREVDIDILLYDDQVIDENDLVIPHPLLSVRRFVLVPLCEIASDIFHPKLNRTMAELLAELEDERRVERLPETISW